MPVHRFLLHNGEIHETSAKIVSPGQTGLLNGWGVFSTLRVKDGVLFAWERHFARMKKDADAMHIRLPQSEALRQDLLRLVEVNAAYDGTLRVVVVRNRGGQFEGAGIATDSDVIAFTKDLTQWGPGCRLTVTENARFAGGVFSGTKILSWSMNLTMLEMAQQRGFDETLLLDNRGFVSECTSANIFAAFGRVVKTPPLTSGCLPGVTRAILLEELHVPGLEIREADIQFSELEAADEVFITSSTRDLLAVVEIEGLTLRSDGPARGQIQAEFENYILRYLQDSPVRAPRPALY